MKPIAILSCDTNPAYLSCIPIVCKSWELQGFDVYVSLVSNKPLEEARKEAAVIVKYLGSVLGGFEKNIEYNPVNPALFTQCIRLYETVNFLLDDRYLILGDADMFIASSFLYRDFDKVNSFGHDLTGFGEVPMCYVGMYASKWREVMGTDGMEKDLANHTLYKSSDWYECWGSDQQILTAKLKAYGFDKVNFINRGHDNRNSGLPLGRLDRYNWVYPTSEIHDVHMMRNPLSDENFPKITEMCQRIYPTEDWSWLHDYRKEFNEAL